MPNSPDHIEIIARALITRQGQILLCKNLKNGYFYLPGGHVDSGETAADACKREIQEELNLSAQIGRCLLITEQFFEQGGQPRHEIDLVFHVEHLADPTREPPILPPNSTSPTNQPSDDTLQTTTMSSDLNFDSAEGHIGFEWVEISKLKDTDLRPANIRDWIVRGGMSSETRFLPG